MSSEEYTVRRVKEEDRSAVLRFLRECFFEDEPLNSYMHRVQTEKIRYRDRGIYSITCLQDGLSTMITNPSGDIIALVLNGDGTYKKAESSESYVENSPMFTAVRGIVHLVERQIDEVAAVQNRQEKEMSLRIMCIRNDWRNKGLGRILLDSTRASAEENGFTQIRSICTSAYSAKMFENYGFQCVYALNYKDYKENGEVVFKPEEPHSAIRGMLLKI